MNEIARQVNTKKKKGFSFSILFSYLISTLFSGKSTYRDYVMHADTLPFSDKTFRNLLNDGRINWQKLLLLIAKPVIAFACSLTDEERKTVFIIDDSMYERPNAKKVELVATQYDHAKHRYSKGFRWLHLGWSDGNSFFPVGFSLLSGKNHVVETGNLDQRTNSGKRKLQALRKGTDVAVELIREAITSGITADYVLFDSWFSSPKMFYELLQLECHTISMVKRSKKVYYRYKGNQMDVKTIFNQEKKRRGRSRYLLSVVVEAEIGKVTFPIKLVYVRNRNKRNDYLVLASTDTALTEEEIIQLYGKRWSTEVYFKMCKHYLHLAKYQGLSYDGIFAHTSSVAIAYMMLALTEREQKDDRTFGELFYDMLEELSDLTFVEAIFQLFELFKEAFKDEFVLSEEILDNILQAFIGKLPTSIQNQLRIAM